MALSSILKNVYTFANILSQAGTDAIKTWDDKSLCNAFNWADYCKKIAEQATSTNLQHDLDIQVQSFTVFLKPASLLFLTLDSLNNAMQILCKRLIQNPSCPDVIIEKVIESLDINRSTVIERRKEVRCALGDSPCLYLLLGEDLEFDGRPVTDIAAYIQDRLLHLSSLSVVSEHRFNHFLELIITKITECKYGTEVLASLLLSDVRSIEQHSDIETLKDKILKIVLQISNNNSGVWRLDVDVLCDLSNRDDVFLDHHTQYILSWLSSMEPVYGITDQGELYTWRHLDNTTHRFSYRSLIEHVTTFTSYNKRLRTKLIPHLENLANKSYFNIYKDVLKWL